LEEKLIRWLIWVVALVVVLLCVGVFSLSIGSTGVSLREMLQALSKGKGDIGYSIVFNLRLPRVLLGFAVGGALSLSGVMLQGLFRNPLVEPYTLGISGGAALGVSLNIALHLYHTAGVVSLPLSGFIGALAVILLLYSLSMRRGILKMQGLLLTGVMISFISSSLIMLIMAVSRAEDLHGIVFWIMGSLGESDWPFVKLMGAASIIGLLLSYFFALDLNALSLGEEEALHLGVNVERSKRLLFVLASLLTGLCVSSAGIIGFVGLVVPHFVRMFVGEDHRILLIASFLCGAGFLVLCDTLARTVIAPLELPVGVITGILGGALFVYALTRREVALGEG
jgi:iron complex transport system permease protein